MRRDGPGDQHGRGRGAGVGSPGNRSGASSGVAGDGLGERRWRTVGWHGKHPHMGTPPFPDLLLCVS